MLSYSETFAPKAGDQYAKVSANDDKIDPDTFENLEFGIRYDLPIGLSFSAAYFEVKGKQARVRCRNYDQFHGKI